MRSRPLIRWLTLFAIVVVLFPVVENWRKKPQDSFPLSYYPMFSERRKPEHKVTYLVGEDKEGRRIQLRYSLAGGGGLNQVRKHIRKYVRDDRADQLCETVAANVTRRTSGSLKRVETVRVVTGEYNLNRYFSGDKTPVEEITHAACEVERKRSGANQSGAKQAMTWIRKNFDNFLFTNLPPERLALLRILVGSFILFYVGSRFEMLTTLAVSDAQLFEPVGLATVLTAPLNPAVFQGLLVATLVANITFIAGFFHRVLAPLFGFLLLCLLCYRNSWSMIYHSDNVMVFHVMILAIAPSAAVISIDAWRAARRGEPAPGWRFGWPVQLMCIVTTISYFVAGVAKLAAQSGWAWAHGESLRSQIAVDGLRKELLGSGAPDLVFILHDEVLLFTFIGIISLILELGAPFALIHRRVSQFWALSAFGMHWGIYFLMGILFRYQLAGLIFLPFFPIERLIPLGRAVAARVSGALGRRMPRRVSAEGPS